MIRFFKLYEQIFLSLFIFYSIQICNNPYISELTCNENAYCQDCCCLWDKHFSESLM